jgi:hypothetical protein
MENKSAMEQKPPRKRRASLHLEAGCWYLNETAEASLSRRTVWLSVLSSLDVGCDSQ